MKGGSFHYCAQIGCECLRGARSDVARISSLVINLLIYLFVNASLRNTDEWCITHNAVAMKRVYL